MNDDLQTSLAASREKLQQRKRLNAAATDLLARRISMVEKATETKTKNTTLGKFLEAIRSGRWEKQVRRIRATYSATLQKNGGDRKKAKKAIETLKTRSLPAALISGTFKRRHRDAIEQHSGLVCADLDEVEQAQLITEVSRVARALKEVSKCDKLNIAALGNVVHQLHVHVIARRKGDAAWPRPVWGVVPHRAHDAGEVQDFISTIRKKIWLG